MKNLETIKSMIENYQIEYEKLNKYRDFIQDAINDIDFVEINKMSYQEVKEILYKLQFYAKKNIISKLTEIKNNKKAELYPEINDAHYYPEIKEMEWLSKEERINLDKLLRSKRINSIEMQIDKKSIKFLLDKKILEKTYVFKCCHDSWDCGEKVITEEYLNGLKEYWEKEKKCETTEDDDKKYNYGCITIPCAYEREEEITTLKEFEEEYCYINYIIIKKPDLTLENL